MSEHEGRHAGKPPTERAEKALAANEQTHEHKHVRVTTEPAAGSDPKPARSARTVKKDNDARLKAEKPPHY